MVVTFHCHQSARGLSARICRLFYLSLQLFTNVFEVGPAGINLYVHAIAAFQVEVAAALRAQPPAIVFADLSDGQSQQNLFLENVFQFQTFTLIVTDFGLRQADRDLVSMSIDPLRTIHQIERLSHRMLHRIQAARTAPLQLDGKPAHQPYILDNVAPAAMLFQQLGPSGHPQRRSLLNVLSQFDYTRRNGLIQNYPSELKILYFYKHKGHSGKMNLN